MSEANGTPHSLPLPTQTGPKYWGAASPTHKLPPSFAGNKDGEERWGLGEGRGTAGPLTATWGAGVPRPGEGALWGERGGA